MRESTVRVDGLNIRCLEEGQGSPILLLHGGTLGFSADVWRGTMPKLAVAGHRVITYDQPGFGVSDSPPDFGLRYRQDFIVKLLDALGVRRPLLVGHSQAGGLVVGAVLATPGEIPRRGRDGYGQSVAAARCAEPRCRYPRA